MFTPVANWNGQASFTFKVADQSDAESAAAATATITVTAVADAPVASDLTRSTAEDTALTFAASDFDGVYTDGDGDGLKAVQVVTLPATSDRACLTLGANGGNGKPGDRARIAGDADVHAGGGLRGQRDVRVQAGGRDGREVCERRRRR